MNYSFDRKSRHRQLALQLTMVVLLLGTGSAVVISATELTKQFAWTHTTPGTALLSGVTVILINLGFIAAHSWSTERELRWLATVGVLLLTTIEIAANYIQGGAAAMDGRVPSNSIAFTGGSTHGLAVLAALLFAAVIPVLTLLCSLCLTCFLKHYFDDGRPAAANPFAAEALAGDESRALEAEVKRILNDASR